MRPHDKHADHLALELAPTYVRTYVCAYVRTCEEDDEGEDHEEDDISMRRTGMLRAAAPRL